MIEDIKPGSEESIDCLIIFKVVIISVMLFGVIYAMNLILHKLGWGYQT